MTNILMTKEQLKRWHREKGIRFLVLDVEDMLDSLNDVDIPILQNLLNNYADHRAQQGRTDGDLDWAIRALTTRSELAFATPPNPHVLRHVAKLLSHALSPQPVTEPGPDGLPRVVSMPKPEDAVGVDHPKVQELIEALLTDATAGLTRVQRALER